MQEKKGKRHRIVWWTLGVSCLLVLIVLLLLHSIGLTQITPITDAQIRAISSNDLAWVPKSPSRPTVELSEIDKVSRGIPYLSLGKDDAEIVKEAAAIEKTRSVTDQVERIIAGKDPAIPIVNARYYGSTGWGLQRAYEYQFFLKVARHNPTAAIVRLKKSEELTDFLERYQGDQVILTTTVPGMLRMGLRDHAFSAAQLRTISSTIPAAPAFDSSLPTSLRFDFQGLAALVKQTTSDDLEHYVNPSYGAAAYSFDPEFGKYERTHSVSAGQFDEPELVSTLAGMFREAIENSRIPWPKENWPRLAPISARIARLPQWPADLDKDPEWMQWWRVARYKMGLRSQPNALGMVMLNGVVGQDGVGILIQASVRNRTMREGARLQVALELYRLTFGRLPASLPELKRLHLPGAEPVDLFADEPFHYNPAKEMFWSVGPNGKDEGGRRGSGADDIAFQLP